MACVTHIGNAGILLALLSVFWVYATSWRHDALRERVVTHIGNVHGELQLLVKSLCGSGARVPSPWEQLRGDVNVPSCAAMQEAKLEEYHGNLNMLLVEAWLGKVMPTLHKVRWYSWMPWDVPRSELITLRADGVDGGAIFVQQLGLDGGAASAAMMIGIHRLPRHKAMRKLAGRAPTAAIVPGVVDKVKEWCFQRGIATLLVCPYQGMGPKLQSLGFRPLADPPPYVFGAAPLMGDVCEEAELHAFDVSETVLPEMTTVEYVHTVLCLACGLMMLYYVWSTNVLDSPPDRSDEATAETKRKR